MATTTLFVEILAIGAIAELWLALFLAAVMPGFTFSESFKTFTEAKEALPALAIVALALTYTVGWVVNFVAEASFKPFFQERMRTAVFASADDYDKARLTMLQYGSAQLVTEVLIDRHIIRIARAGAFNFAGLTVALVFWSIRTANGLFVKLAVLALLFAAVSFVQWRKRYGSHYRRIAQIAAMHLDAGSD